MRESPYWTGYPLPAKAKTGGRWRSVASALLALSLIGGLGYWKLDAQADPPVVALPTEQPVAFVPEPTIPPAITPPSAGSAGLLKERFQLQMRHSESEGSGTWALTFMVLTMLVAVAAFIIKLVVELHMQHSETPGPLLVADGIALAVAALAIVVGSPAAL